MPSIIGLSSDDASRCNGMSQPATIRPMAHLRSVALRSPPLDQEARFPFTVPVIRTLPTLDVNVPVTFLVGENGSGKSTLLEALAVAARLPTVGSASVGDDATLAAQRELADALKLTWNRRTPRGFFLRAEDFFGFAKELSRMRAMFLREIATIDATYEGRSERAKALAKM